MGGGLGVGGGGCCNFNLNRFCTSNVATMGSRSRNHQLHKFTVLIFINRRLNSKITSARFVIIKVQLYWRESENSRNVQL